MATIHHTPHERDKSNGVTLWTTLAILVLAAVVYIVATRAWSTHSPATGADAEAQKTAVQPTTAEGAPVNGGTPKGDLPRP